ncbi:MAG: CBS domain-containing protein, partial [Anaerolineales bacterium]|nr:CBS domain-containing protein [Anaerolineales bacterium]
RVIDHHAGHTPKEGWRYQVEIVGATTTLLVEKLQANGLTLAVVEATLLLLGIYEDTGSLTYDTTTTRDAQAAAWLLEQGAQLPVVRRFLNIPLTQEQQTLYKELQAAATWVKVGGRQIVVTGTAVPATFTDEISSVVHRLRDALLPAGLFALVQIGRDVQLVARSNEDHVDVSLVARALGGGGHSRAAAALITKQELAEVKARVLALLPQAVKPPDTVAQIMSYGVQTVSSDMPVAEAAALMQRVGYEGYPVVDPQTEQLVGLLTRRAVDRAMNHEMARFPIQRIMKSGTVTVHPGDSIERLQQVMLEEGWGQVPVVVEQQAPGKQTIIGVVTRTDMLNYLFQPAASTGGPEIRNLLEKSLREPMWQMVVVIGDIANNLNMPLYFVGGLVRDVLLGKSPKDLDMVVEGDAIRLVQQLQARYGGQVHTHRRFGTAKWFTTAEIWQKVAEDEDARNGAETAVFQTNNLPESIDFVTARTEFYREPSALPDVERGSIKLDLHRRDFTINTLAVRLDGVHLGELLDF